MFVTSCVLHISTVYNKLIRQNIELKYNLPFEVLLNRTTLPFMKSHRMIGMGDTIRHYVSIF